FMVYATTGIPAGAYQLNRLSALGIGHWAADGGVGYTYLNEKAGIEGSIVFGLTYDFINPYTQYQSGTDAHLDWALSPLLTDKFHIGAVGYVYNQITGDSGLGARLGDFRSRVAGIGPQIGFFIPFFDRQSYLNLGAIPSSMSGTGSKDGTPSLRSPLRLPGRRSPLSQICDESARAVMPGR